jgi:hypothetical protein
MMSRFFVSIFDHAYQDGDDGLYLEGMELPAVPRLGEYIEVCNGEFPGHYRVIEIDWTIYEEDRSNQDVSRHIKCPEVTATVWVEKVDARR